MLLQIKKTHKTSCSMSPTVARPWVPPLDSWPSGAPCLLCPALGLQGLFGLGYTGAPELSHLQVACVILPFLKGAVAPPPPRPGPASGVLRCPLLVLETLPTPLYTVPP